MRFAISGIIALIIVGLVDTIIRIVRLNKRLEYTTDYRNQFIAMNNEYMKNRNINQETICKLTKEDL